MGDTQNENQVPAKVVVLTHYLPPYVADVMRRLSGRCKDLDILLSIEQEPNRQFGETWRGLDVAVQRSLMFRRPWVHKGDHEGAGFRDELFVHVPYDTFSQLIRRRPDIVFSFELGFRSLASAVYAKLWRKQLALCVCVSEHTELHRGWLRTLLRKRLIKMADAVSYNGPSCKTYLKKLGVKEEQLFHFPYAINDQFTYTYPLERSLENQFRLICVGQLIERKGVTNLLHALKEYGHARPESSIELDLVGTGPLQDQLRSEALPSNVTLRFLGYMAPDELSKAMSKAGALIFPTLADEWGLVVNEAMAAGLPVIGSRYSQAAETLIKSGENGWIFSPDEPQSLFGVLDDFLSRSSEEILKMREMAQKTVEGFTSSYPAERAAEKFEDLLTRRGN